MGTTDKVLVIYHANCLDGFGAAFLTEAWLSSQNVPCEFFPAQYGQEPPDVRGRQVVIVDFSYPREVMERLAVEASHIRCIDHHKTAEAALAGLDWCMFDMDRSACRIAWDTWFRGHPPDWVRYIEDRDLWRKSLPGCDEFSAYMRTVPHESDPWRVATRMPVERVVELGHAIRRYQKTLVTDALSKKRSALIGGKVVPCVNYTTEYSEIAGELADNEHGYAAVWFVNNAGEAVFSLRSRGGNAPDVSAIAKSYGGGGHKSAAGFQVPLSDAVAMLRLPDDEAGEGGEG